MAHKFSYEEAKGEIPEGMEVDHICHNPACVRPSHLRLATKKQNAENLQGANINSASGLRGASWNASAQRWIAVVGHNGKRIQVGSFLTAEEAGQAARAKRNELYTHNDADRKST